MDSIQRGVSSLKGKGSHARAATAAAGSGGRMGARGGGSGRGPSASPVAALSQRGGPSVGRSFFSPLASVPWWGWLLIILHLLYRISKVSNKP